MLLGPGLGLIGSAARRTDLLGVAAAWVLPVGAVTEMALLPQLDPYGSGIDLWLTSSRVALVVAAGVGALVAVVRWLIARLRSGSGPQPYPMPTGSAPTMSRWPDQQLSR